MLMFIGHAPFFHLSLAVVDDFNEDKKKENRYTTSHKCPFIHIKKKKLSGQVQQKNSNRNSVRLQLHTQLIICGFVYCVDF